MKKFMKGCAITALILLVLGFALSIVAGNVEGTSGVDEIVESVTNGLVHLNLGTDERWGVSIDGDDWIQSEALYDIDDSMIFDNDYDVFNGDVEKYALGSNVSKMDIEAGGCAIYFKTSDDDNFYVEAKDAGKFQCFVKSDTLFVKTTRTAVDDWDEFDDCEIILYIPANYSFEHVDVELGAGLLEMGDIATNEMDLEVGAGQITMKYLQAGQCDIEVGMGEIIVDDMLVNNVNTEVGMGHLQMGGIVQGDADVECSMGAIEMFLKGSETDFNYTMEAAMGNVTVGDESYSGLTDEKTVKNGADKNMSIECAMGNILVEFAD